MANFSVISFGINAAGAISGAARTVQAIQSVGSAADKATKEAHNFEKQVQSMFTAATRFFSLLAGAAGFTSLIGGMKSFIEIGVEFNKTIEESRIGIAALMLAAGKFQNASTGQAVTGMQAFAAATQIAEGTLNQLQLANLKTAATLDDLIKGYQQALGPGLAAGLSSSQVVKITTDLTNAALVLRVNFKEIGQELRAILTGQINVNARVAQALGITNEMVKNWRAQGTLAAELEQRFKAFAQAGESVANTFTGALSNLQDTLARMAGEMTRPLMDAIAQAAKAFNDAFVNKDTGKLMGLDNVLATLRSISEYVSTFILGGANKVIDAIKDADKWLKTNRQTVDQLRVAIDVLGKSITSIVGQVELSTRNVKMLAEATKFVGFVVAGIADAWDAVSNTINLVGATLVRNSAQFELYATMAVGARPNPKLLKEIEEYQKQINDANAALARGSVRVQEMHDRLRNLEEAAKGAGRAMEGLGASAGLSVGAPSRAALLNQALKYTAKPPTPGEDTAKKTAEEMRRLRKQIADEEQKAEVEAIDRQTKAMVRFQEREQAQVKYLEDLGHIDKLQAEINIGTSDQVKLAAEIAGTNEKMMILRREERILEEQAKAETVKGLTARLELWRVQGQLNKLEEQSLDLALKKYETELKTNAAVKQRADLLAKGARLPDVTALIKGTPLLVPTPGEIAGFEAFNKQAEEKRAAESYEVQKAAYNRLLDYRREQEQRFQQDIISPLADSVAQAFETGMREGWGAGAQGILKTLQSIVQRGLSEGLQQLFSKALGVTGPQMTGGGLFSSIMGAMGKSQQGGTGGLGSWIKDIWGRMVGSSEKVSQNQLPGMAANSTVQTSIQRSMDMSLLGIGSNVLMMTGMMQAMGGGQSTSSILLGGLMAGIGTFGALGGFSKVGKALGFGSKLGGAGAPNLIPSTGGPTITFPTNQMMAGLLQQGVGAATNIVNMNITTPDAGSFQRSQDQIYSQMQRGLSKAQRNA